VLAALLLHVTTSITKHMARKALLAMNADSDMGKLGSASPATVSTTQSRRPMTKKRRQNGTPEASAPLLDETFFLEENATSLVVERRTEESLQESYTNPAASASASALSRMEASDDIEAGITAKVEKEDEDVEMEGGREREKDLVRTTSTGWQQIEKLSVDRTAVLRAPQGMPNPPYTPHIVTRCLLVEDEERVLGYVVRFLLYIGLMERCTESTQQL
jgi:hypothetical protein